MKKLLVILNVLLLIGLSGCSFFVSDITDTKKTSITTTEEEDDYTGYYIEEFDNPLIDRDMGGKDYLSLTESSSSITLENEKVRIIINKSNGGISEIANKEAHLYLAQNASSIPFSAFFINENREISSFKKFNYQVKENTDLVKKIELKWELESGQIIISNISLKNDGNEIIFNLEVQNNLIGKPLYYIEYPIIQNIGSLYNKNTDYLVHPLATGYVFNNPLDNFNKSSNGITRDIGLYPSGWETTMQFYAYYSYNIGGFLFRTKDGGNTIKSFAFRGDNTKLRASIYHYADDISLKTVTFNYDISIGNLVEGRWEEAAEIYKEWATKQSWCKNGIREDKDDIDKQFYEETVLCNFNYPYYFYYTEKNQKDLYSKLKNNIDGKILNIYFVTDGIISLAHEYDDYIVKFEFPDFRSENELTGSEVKDYEGNIVKYNLNGERQYYECATDTDYLRRFMAHENELRSKYQVSGYYHDVGVAAVHPKQCFNTNHSHGTRINVVSDYLEEMAMMKRLSRENGATIYGQELIFEQMIPYIDFYQTRANALNVGFMEGDRFNNLIIKGVCYPVDMFEYIYREYTGIRLDGFLDPDPGLVDVYTYIAEYTVMHGGIPEFNFEFVDDNFIEPNDMPMEMIEFIGYLSIVKQTFGLNYLVYGEETRAPKINSTRSTYSFSHKKEISLNRSGTITLDDLITSAFKFNNKIGIFVGNTTKNTQSLNFVLDTYRYYGINSGEVTLIDVNGDSHLVNIKNGKARISIELEPQKIVLLEIREAQ